MLLAVCSVVSFLKVNEAHHDVRIECLHNHFTEIEMTFEKPLSTFGLHFLIHLIMKLRFTPDLEFR